MPKHVEIAIRALITATLALATPVAAQSVFSHNSPGKSERAVLDVEHDLLQARVTNNTATHKAHFAPEGVYIHSSGWAQNRDEVLDMVARSPWAQWQKSEEEVHLYGNLAVTHSLLKVLLVDKRIETVRTTGVYVKQSDVWRQVSWQSSAGHFVGP